MARPAPLLSCRSRQLHGLRSRARAIHGFGRIAVVLAIVGAVTGGFFGGFAFAHGPMAEGTLENLFIADVSKTEPAASDPSRPAVALLSNDFPLHFIENAGQIDERVAYYVHGRTTSIYFTNEGLTYSLRDPLATSPGGWVMKQDFVGAEAVAPGAEDPTPATISYFKGNRAEWKAGIKTYTNISYRDLWPGIDLEYSGKVHTLKHSFLVRPGADPSRIRIRIRGATMAEIKNDGSLEIDTPSGSIVDAAPYVYQLIDGLEVEVPAAYDLDVDPETGYTEYGFTIANFDPTLPLVVDPATLVYCGYIGGSESDSAYAIDIDSSGSAYVTGMTLSDQTTFPVNTGPDLTYNGGNDVFVAKIASDGSGLVWAGFIGGDGFELPWGIAVDSAGSAYVTGYTESDQTTFPITVGPRFWRCRRCVCRKGVTRRTVARILPIHRRRPVGSGIRNSCRRLRICIPHRLDQFARVIIPGHGRKLQDDLCWIDGCLRGQGRYRRRSPDLLYISRQR